MNNFYSAMYLANLLYGVSFTDEDEFAEIALVGFQMIGNKRAKLHHFCTKVECDSFELPCNVDEIESITYGFEDWNYTSNTTVDIDSSITEQYIENRKHFTSPFYQKGKFVKYERVGNTIYLDKPLHSVIHVLYKGWVADDDGLPEITDAEKNALATFVAYVLKNKEAMITNNSGIAQIAANLEKKWNVLCDEARAGFYLNLNDLNEILEAKMLPSLKVFNKSFKPIR